MPTAIVKFPADTFSSVPRAWLESVWNVQQYTEFDSGGHFPALEEPGTVLSAFLVVVSSGFAESAFKVTNTPLQQIEMRKVCVWYCGR